MYQVVILSHIDHLFGQKKRLGFTKE
ncbi:hypothetical protein HID58_079586 [Brassica napus]|uniref:Uncharacterized protein n=1 Tax=Brassica napus TaxID=3708 RepID=A0ABQ7Y2F1_BRANA|nr:hypothetical protein HID58_079586 [Brassica napus]